LAVHSCSCSEKVAKVFSAIFRATATRRRNLRGAMLVLLALWEMSPRVAMTKHFARDNPKALLESFVT
jgi:hypothetical protein